MQNSFTISSQMELPSLHHSSSPLTALPSSLLFRSNLLKRQLFYGEYIKFSKCPCVTSSRNSHIRAQLLSGVMRVSSPTIEASTENVNSKNDNIVFVAGATGKVGSRTVRELLKLGCQVRAGVRSAQRAESLIQSVKQMKGDTDAESGRTPIEMLEIVECDLEKPGQILPALGKASVIICCIGASEKEISDVTGPYRIDFLATKNLIEAATAAKINHFLLVTSLGTNKFGFPAAILNLFWGVLCWKRKAEEALIASGLPYTIVRPGGMERPTDSYKETHNLTLAPEDTLFGGQVSNLQVAELLAFMAQNRDLSYCKILEVVAETTAPLTPMAELLVKIPSKREDFQKPKEKDGSSKPFKVEPGPELEPVRSFIAEVPTNVTEKEPIQDKNIVARPLSPYTMYDNLKPPSSPCPSAPNSLYKQVRDNTEPSTQNTSSETQSGTFKKVVAEPQKTQPLSPYTAYEDLEPPSSPYPSSPGNACEESLMASKAVDGVPRVIDGTVTDDVLRDPIFYHSPFPVYEDLKPPSSPCPSSPGNTREESLTTLKAVDDVPKVDGTLAKDVHRESILYHSPFPVYEDFKPPTSPTPSAPNSSVAPLTSSTAESQLVSFSNNGAPEPAEVQIVGDEQAPTQPKPRPLSPYTMYDDLKPPTTPTPSPGDQ